MLSAIGWIILIIGVILLLIGVFGAVSNHTTAKNWAVWLVIVGLALIIIATLFAGAERQHGY